MLCGEYRYNIDAKGRLNFPAKLREGLGESFVLAKSITDDCITVYPMDRWEQLVLKIDALPISKSRNIKRRLFATSEEVFPDKQGRILIPQSLRDFAHLDREVVVAGVSDYCEIWNQEAWDKLQESITTEDLTAVVEELGI